MHWLASLVDAWASRLGVSSSLLNRLLASAGVLVAYVLIDRVARRTLARVVEDAASRYQFRKAIDYALGVLAFAVLVRLWFQGFGGLATYLGLLSAGVAVALQDPLINLAGWLFIVTRSPFSVGDRIEIGGKIGDVVDIRLFQFTLLEIGNWVDADQSTGRVIHVPDGWVFKHPVANYDRGFRYIWNELAVVVTFESNWKRAKEVLLRTVTEHAEHLTVDAMRQIDAAAERYHIKFTKLTPVVWTSVVDSGVRLTMRYLCKPRERRASQHEIWEAVLEQFAALDDVELAYPTTRIVGLPTNDGPPPTRQS